jgi:ribosomal protein L19
MLMEQSDEQPPNIAKDIEDKIDQDNQEYETADMEPGDDIEDDEDTPTSGRDRVQKYRISGGILALHGKGKTDTDITTDDKLAFQETMDEFVDEVSDLVDFNTLNVYPNNVEWSGKIIDEDIDFTFTIGEDSGIYINGDMVKVDNEFLELINKLQQYYQKFKSKWSRILASRKKTRETNG